MHSLLIVLGLVLIGCSGSDVVVTAPGALAQFDTEALHNAQTSPPEGDVQEIVARCTYVSPDENHEFSVLANARHFDGVLSNISITTIESDCALDVILTAPTRYYEVGGRRDSRSSLQLSFTCPGNFIRPGISGSASLTIRVSERNFVMGGSTASCTRVD